MLHEDLEGEKKLLCVHWRERRMRMNGGLLHGFSNIEEASSIAMKVFFPSQIQSHT